MYGIQGSSWITMGDPVGDVDEFEALLWDFRERADRVGDSTAHYQVDPEHLHLYVDLGMSLFKVGEVGRVPLPDLTLEGKTWVDLRKARNRFEKLGAEFTIIPREEVAGHLPELRAVSDDWLASRNTREKGFSLGRFEDDYMKRNPVAVLRLEGSIIAFASLWAGENREEVSIDLMRYLSAAPKGSMDCIFGNLLLWGRDEGYRYFWLGMAPLAGLEDHRLAPLWHRFGDILFDHGERFYNFRGLYDFKEKFEPEWESRYLAVSSVSRFPQTLADLTALVGGGFKGVLGK
jgi:phosphatidylglycerol lysyltransferase